MINSIPTIGFSEIMHDARTDPAEASFVYGAVAVCAPGQGLTATLMPAVFGTVKSARMFTLRLRSAAGDASALPTPLDLALTGVGSCALTTFLIGGTAKRQEFDGADLTITFRSNASARTNQLAVELNVDGELEREVVLALTQQMAAFSPNYATMTGAVPVRLVCDDGGYTVDTVAAATGVVSRKSSGRLAEAVSHVDWVSGMQLLATSRGVEAPLRVDQPKQVGGVDWGPNPQEYLLMALAADVAGRLGDAADRMAGLRQTWRVRATAKEDIRGLLLRQYEVVTLLNVTCTVEIPRTNVGQVGVTALVAEAFHDSQVRELIERPCSTTLDVV